VQVTDGPFTNFTGLVDEVKADRGRVRVMISVFGRPTPVELEFTQLEKI
ncbi:MAG: KOW motif-containing protein, partial [Proteobacteria bacterium]|nr:KOW motif-containing protein [Pseudomonadota bacterium]